MVLRFLFIASLLLLGCGDLQFNNPADPYSVSHPSDIAYQPFTDSRDGKTYNSVVIGTQTWMAENLNYATVGSYCVGNVEHDGEIRDTILSEGGYCDIYGRFYKWETAKNICPSGWHLPSQAEWRTLINFAGSGNKLKSKSGWHSDNGTDDYGFTARPTGGDGNYTCLGCWWSASEESSEEISNYAYVWGVYSGSLKAKTALFSVRCIKGNIPYSTVTFNANGATSGNVPASISVVSGDNAKIPSNGSLQKTGYVFNGWSISNSSTNNPEYKAGSLYPIPNNITIYANWVPIRTVTFDGNNATSGTAPSSMTAGSGFSIFLPGQGTLEKDGYLFVNWNTSGSGTGTSYNAGSSYNVINDITLYAIWGVSCTIIFSGANVQDIMAGLGATIQLPPAPSSSNYTFGGWKSSNTGTTYAASSSYAVAGNDTLSAIWNSIPLGSIIVKHDGINGTTSIIKLVVGTRTFGTGTSPFINYGSSYTVSGLSAGTYTVTAYYFVTGGGGTTRTVSKTVTVSGNTVMVSF